MSLIYNDEQNRLTITKTTDFIGNFVYENYLPAYIVYDEGRVVFNSKDRSYFAETYIKDHLGNVRIAFRSENGVLKTRQVNSYYPFGMNIKGLSQNGIDLTRPNEYLYNSKMMQDEMGLGWLDYGWREYDPVLGRFHVPDPLVELHYNYTPFAYCYNNPIRLIDQFGLDTTDTHRKATPEEMENFNKAKKQGTTIYQAQKEDDSNDPSSPNYNSQESHGRAINYPDGMDWRYRPETATFMWLGAATEDLFFFWVDDVGNAYRTLTDTKASAGDKLNATFNAAFSLAFGLPGKGNKNFTKLKGTQGWKDPEGNRWNKDLLHKDHYDVTDAKNNKIAEVDFNGNKIWPEGPKNKNKK